MQTKGKPAAESLQEYGRASMCGPSPPLLAASGETRMLCNAPMDGCCLGVARLRLGTRGCRDSEITAREAPLADSVTTAIGLPGCEDRSMVNLNPALVFRRVRPGGETDDHRSTSPERCHSSFGSR